MGKIYSLAEQVIVWVGDSRGQVAELWRCLKRLDECENDSFMKPVDSSEHDGATSENHDQLYDTEGIKTQNSTLPIMENRTPKFDSRHIQHGSTYMRYCGWFDRVWTFQEVVLAQHCVVRSGADQIDWHLLWRYWHKSWKVRRGRVDDVKDAPRHLKVVHDTKETPTGRLLSLLLAVWTRQATDSRDKVFSILGLCPGTPKIRAQHSLTTRAAMVMASQACILQNRNLDLLYFAGRDVIRAAPDWDPWYREQGSGRGRYARVKDILDYRSSDGNWHVPSWVPDWGSVLGKYLGSATQPIDKWTKIELSRVVESFLFDVRWQGESLVAVGIVLGRGSTGWRGLPPCVDFTSFLVLIQSASSKPLVKANMSQLCMEIRLKSCLQSRFLVPPIWWLWILYATT